ncbi:MAG: tRNA epoxyqueuosine(34) reductase QueG [Magnetococcales bacterium]|nr:tRNA epoxyqueuosine(34) reductase QueG [Magnetococcales bacterium]
MLEGHGISNSHPLKEIIRQLARQCGFAQAGFAAPDAAPYSERLPLWLAEQRHGQMHWMERQPEQRMQPRCYQADVGTIVVLGYPYSHGRYDAGSAGIARYACRPDYHDLLQQNMALLVERIQAVIGDAIPIRRCVDSAPLMEKPLATAAGMGWQGKNSLLVSRQFGCWLLLCELLLPLSLPADPPVQRSHCGRCQRCQQACPTDALATPYWIDASRCLAYLTIEYKGIIPRPYRQAMATRLYGCDSCLTVCPWNRFAPVTFDADTASLEARWQALTWMDYATLDQDRFRQLFGATPVARVGLKRLLRNVAVALGNCNQPDQAVPALTTLLHHPDALVRAHAVWGLGCYQASSQQALLALQAVAQIETAPEVREELAELER